MKKIFILSISFLFSGGVLFVSCKKEKSCVGCINGNKPPTAVAGPDVVITLPTDSISLDGSASNDPDGTISEWFWAKNSGPSSFNIANTNAAQTRVTNLVEGIYQFELKVMDNKGLFTKDTVQITVRQNASPSTEIVFNSLIWQHWHQSNLPTDFTAFDEIYFYVPDSVNVIHNNAAKASFSVWVKRDLASTWEKASNIVVNGNCTAPFWYSLVQNALLIELCYPWDWSLIGKEASVKISF